MGSRSRGHGRRRGGVGRPPAGRRAEGRHPRLDDAGRRRRRSLPPRPRAGPAGSHVSHPADRQGPDGRSRGRARQRSQRLSRQAVRPSRTAGTAPRGGPDGLAAARPGRAGPRAAGGLGPDPPVAGVVADLQLLQENPRRRRITGSRSKAISRPTRACSSATASAPTATPRFWPNWKRRACPAATRSTAWTCGPVVRAVSRCPVALGLPRFAGGMCRLRVAADCGTLGDSPARTRMCCALPRYSESTSWPNRCPIETASS